MSYRTLSEFCRTVIPLFQKVTDGQRILSNVARIVETDRWNSFDQFHHTSRTIEKGYINAGVKPEVYPVPTGGQINSGRWIIHEAADVHTATCDVIEPIQQKIIDYKENPWNVMQWSANTPSNGLKTELIILDTLEELNLIPIGGLTGKTVLTCMDPREQLKSFSDKGASCVITDRPVPNNPCATHWGKFGWGGIPIENAAVRLVGLVISEIVGNELRKLVQRYGKLFLRTHVQGRRYVGNHDLVSGTILGCDKPQEELWALAHSYEPGAHDNASGVAICLEIAQLLEGLIKKGDLPRPLRSIRLLNAYECFGFFHYAENVNRESVPLAGVCIDTVGAKPTVCEGRLSWRATLPMSAGFVDRVGARILQATLNHNNPGYHLAQGPFVSTSDTLLGDPLYGFPCPWLTTHYRKRWKVWDAYHSSADTLDKLSPHALATCTAAMAGYLYYLANAGHKEVIQLASSETNWIFNRLKTTNSKDEATFLCDRHHISLERLKRWLDERTPSNVLLYLNDCEQRIQEIRPKKQKSYKRNITKIMRIPYRTAFLSPTLENTPPQIAKKIRTTQLPAWTLFWADGKRTLAEIASALTVEQGKKISSEQVVAFFDAHAELGYCNFFDSQINS